MSKNSHHAKPQLLAEDKRFFYCLATGLCVWAGLSIVVPFLTVPEKTREELEALPPQLTKFVLKQKLEAQKQPVQQPKPIEIKKELPKKEIVQQKPKPKPEVVQPKPVAKPKVEPKPEKIRESIAEKKPIKRVIEASVQERAVAREQASQSGILAMQKGLSALVTREGPAVPAARIGKISDAAAPRAKTAISAMSSGGSGGQAAAVVTAGDVQTLEVAHATGSVANAKAGQVLADASGSDTASRAKTTVAGQRDESEIRQVFERNKAAIYSIYARAQRKNENLAGKLVLEIKINASGRVESLRLIDSELGDKNLEKRIMTRVKMFTFGEDNVSALTMRYTFDFVAS